MNKEALIGKVVLKLEKEIAELEEGATSAHAASVDAPGAMQSHSDTSKFQNKVSEENLVSMLDEKKNRCGAIKTMEIPSEISEIKIGACILAEDGENEKRYILLPGGAGIEVWDDETLDSYMTITPEVPIGKALMGKKEGIKTVFKVGSKEKKLLIKKVW